MRKSHGSDFFVDVEYTIGADATAKPPNPGRLVSLGRFRFARRIMKDMFLIRGEYSRLTNGAYATDDPALDWGAWAVATLDVLLVESPASFDLSTVDPLIDEEWENKVTAIFAALRAMELSFRTKRDEKGESGGSGASQNVSAAVSAAI